MSQPVTFVDRAGRLLGTPEAAAVDRATRHMTAARDAAIEELSWSGDLRDRVRRIRLHSLANLDRLIARFADRLEEAGGSVHFAADAAEANEIVAGILDRAGARRVVKGKSMLSEEIGLNEHLEAAGLEVTETDLGEYIAQLAGDTPSHIIAPVLHMTRQDVGRVFAERLGVPYTDEPAELNAIARAALRDVFLDADAGITGVNFAVADSGSVVVVTNEGNGRFSSTAPRVHIALMGLERIVPDWPSASLVLESLARSATGQRLSVYTNVITGPRRADDPDGPEEVHVVIVDNGRTAVLSGDTAEILACIRCGACLNVCPVFRTVGGHGYGSVYSGPVGAVLTPSLEGLGPWSDLPYASTLCGACEEVCPVGIRIPSMLLELRRMAAEQGHLPEWIEGGVRTYARAASSPGRFRRARRLARLVSGPFSKDGWIRRLPGRGSGWTRHRDLRRPSRVSFAEWWRSRGA
ncbi:MAG: iron-sulfur cluster-binding protein [Acidimicrobiales bacterium]|jgi:L-lactate dehydrogenase complex protein LldF|nr:iron-sulfur cluster-binding protein [Acidimicrobiales bacterium]HLV90598.1 LutB/LldF family L-lactate oxidation iron-sulfur protein [Acidimicrobiia bacterium]